MKYSFKNDYSEGCHPLILEELSQHNNTQEEGYSEDQYCKEASSLIKELCNSPEADVHFVSGGTQTNLVSIAHALRPFESVIANEMSHIATHETGAIEATGHKVNTIKRADGKLSPEDIQPVLDEHYFEHAVSPRLVFISNTTEIGSVYTKTELKKLYEYCNKNNLYLYIDGARLGTALTAKSNDMQLTDIANYCDAFYIGGTKNGFLLGEALIIINDELKSHMRYQLKQKGALLAKGRIYGIQFNCMLKNNLFFQCAKNANKMAYELANEISALGFDFLTPPESNQIFPILPNETIKKLENDFGFYIWAKIDSKMSCIRLVTSWKTTKNNISEFIESLKKQIL